MANCNDDRVQCHVVKSNQKEKGHQPYYIISVVSVAKDPTACTYITQMVEVMRTSKTARSMNPRNMSCGGDVDQDGHEIHNCQEGDNQEDYKDNKPPSGAAGEQDGDEVESTMHGG